MMTRTTELLQEDIDYPRDIFNALIGGNSPYAFYLFQWVPYQTEAKKRRLKMCHDVKTFDGREAFGIWPNADHCGPFRDDEVAFIRISKDQHGMVWQDPRPASAVESTSATPAEDPASAESTSILRAMAMLKNHGYTVTECVPTEDGGHLYVLDPVHCVAGKTLTWTEDRPVRIGDYAEACKFLSERA